MIYLVAIFFVSLALFVYQLARAYRAACHAASQGFGRGHTYGLPPEWWLTRPVVTAATAVLLTLLLMAWSTILEATTHKIVEAETAHRLAHEEAMLKLIEGQQAIIAQQHKRLRALESPPRPAAAKKITL